MKKDEQGSRKGTKKDEKKKKLTVEQLEERIAPADKKTPVPPPYPPGADYGVIRRRNLSW